MCKASLIVAYVNVILFAGMYTSLPSFYTAVEKKCKYNMIRIKELNVTSNVASLTNAIICPVTQHGYMISRECETNVAGNMITNVVIRCSYHGVYNGD